MNQNVENKNIDIGFDFYLWMKEKMFKNKDFFKSNVPVTIAKIMERWLTIKHIDIITLLSLLIMAVTSVFMLNLNPLKAGYLYVLFYELIKIAKELSENYVKNVCFILFEDENYALKEKLNNSLNIIIFDDELIEETVKILYSEKKKWFIISLTAKTANIEDEFIIVVNYRYNYKGEHKAIIEIPFSNNELSFAEKSFFKSDRLSIHKDNLKVSKDLMQLIEKDLDYLEKYFKFFDFKTGFNSILYVEDNMFSHFH